MLFNPFTTTLATLPGSRMLQETLGLMGAAIPDPLSTERLWRITNLYAPLRGRMLGGIRAKLEDQKGFITFCNQRDLELLLGVAQPGQWCPWTDEDYPEFHAAEFYGLCADGEDLRDDLFERELQLRVQEPGVLPHGFQLTRRIHLSTGNDFEEVDMMLYDCDPETGYGPDPRLSTLLRRWTRVSRDRMTWRKTQPSPAL